MQGREPREASAVRRPILVTVAVLALLAGACRSAGPGSRPAADPLVPEATGSEEATAMADEQSPGAEAPENEPKVYKNTVKWSTASEVDNFGFDVYRGDRPDGPFERLNPDAIEGGGTTDIPRRYRFVDDTIDPCRTYYYYVESISMSGDRERFTPVGKAPPKIRDPCPGDG